MSQNTELQTMIESARKAFNNAYAPYSQFKVGAAVISSNGNIYSGCNIENASYGLTNCAERNAIGQAATAADLDLKSVVIFTETEKLTPPCGACRQVIAEFIDGDGCVTAINHKGESQVWTVSQLLPDAFTPKDLNI